MNGASFGFSLGATREPPLESAYSFTVAETARLTIYRAAIQAGFYSDQFAPRRRGARATGGGRHASTLLRAANEFVIDAQLSEWFAPQRR
jgi:hypothetical protein